MQNFNYIPMTKNIEQLHAFFARTIERHKLDFDEQREPRDFIDVFLLKRHNLNTEEGEYRYTGY